MLKPLKCKKKKTETKSNQKELKQFILSFQVFVFDYQSTFIMIKTKA